MTSNKAIIIRGFRKAGQKLFGLALLASSLNLSAQQPQVYNQFFMNPYLYNPAYVGVEGHTAFFLDYKQQWANIDGGPETVHASFHVPLRGGVAIGATAFNIAQGLLTTSAGKATVGYLINIDRTHFLRFGMSIGGGMNFINITEFDSPDDPAFNNFLSQNSFLIGDFGMAYHFGHFNVGFSIPNLFTYDVVTQTDFAPVSVTPLDNVLFKMNYRGHISDDFAVEPHIIYRYSQVLPHQYEGTLIAHLKHIVWVGASFREDSGFIGLVGAKVKEKIGMGFAYELGNPDISSELGPTFEVKIGYHLGIKKEHAEHMSSFIKSRRLSAEERAQKAELERQKQIAEQKNSEDEYSEDELGVVGEPTKLDQADSQVENTPPEDSIGTAGNYVVVKRGNHLLELPTGNFVIAGAFEVFEHAENYSDDLFQQGYRDVIVGFSSARGYYYVVVFQSGNVQQARKKRDELRKLPEFSKAWVLQVTKQ